MENILILMFKLFVFIFGAYLLIGSVNNVIKKGGTIFDYVFFIFFIFNILPVGLDVFYETPDVSFYPLFMRSIDDLYTNLIYDTYMIVIMFFAKKKIIKKNSDSIIGVQIKNIYPILQYIIFLVSILPILLVLTDDDPLSYLIYSSHEGLNDKDNLVRSLVYATTSLSVLVIFLNSILLGFKIKYIVLMSPIIFCDIWLNGKRNIVALIVVLFLFVLFHNKTLGKYSKMFYLSVICLVMMLFNSVYQNDLRGGVRTLDEYSAYRIDFGRDLAIKATIYKFLHSEEEKPILEYPGQSFVFYSTIFISRDSWPEKPLPYAQYFTSAVLDSEIQLWGWGLTTSILEETISNFGLLGFFLGPFIIYWFLQKGNKSKNIYIQLLTIMIVGIFLTVEITAYFIILCVWFLLIFLNKRFMRNDYKLKPLNI